MDIKPRFKYRCKDCGHVLKTIWVLKICVKCKGKNIETTNLRIKTQPNIYLFKDLSETASMPQNDILRLINEGTDIDEVAGKYADADKCVAQEFNEAFPYWCGEYPDCFECWERKITSISEEE